MYAPVVLDVETQYLFQEVNHDLKRLKVSIACLYDYTTDQYYAYEEHQLKELFTKLEHASAVIGYNIRKFDLPVLAPYYVGNVEQFPVIDLMEEVEKTLGFRLSLNDIAQATLGVKKSGHGFLAIEYFRKGEMEKLKSYCTDDVKITKQLYDWGLREKRIFFNDRFGRKDIKVNFQLSPQEPSSVSLSLPF